MQSLLPPLSFLLPPVVRRRPGRAWQAAVVLVREVG